MGGVGQEFKNTLEQITMEGIGQNTLKQIDPSIKNVQSNCSNVHNISSFTFLSVLEIHDIVCSNSITRYACL